MPIESDVVFLDDNDDKKLQDKDNEERIAKDYHDEINDDDYDHYYDSNEEDDEDLETEEFKIQEEKYLKNNFHPRNSPSEIIELLDSDDDDDEDDDDSDENDEDNGKDDDNTFNSMSKRSFSIFTRRTPLTSSANTSKKPKKRSQGLLFDLNAHQKKTPLLSQQTKAANKEERDRLRMLNNLKFYGSNDSNNEDDVINILRAPEDSIVRISSQIFQNMKPHQIEAVRFMWKNIVGSISVLKQSMNASILPLDEKPSSSEQSTKTKDNKKVVASSGCVLAHCMGLGKTFSVVSFTVTLLTNPKICYGLSGKEKPIFNRVLVVVPVNTLENWRIEYKKWTPAELNLQVYLINSNDNTAARFNKLKKWYEGGGVCIVGYNMFLVIAMATATATATEAKVFNLNRPAAVSSSSSSASSSSSSSAAAAAAAASSDKETGLNLSGNKKDSVYADSLFEVVYYYIF